VNFDVPARRLLYVNLFVAFLFGILWDTAAQDASETPSLPSSGRLARLGVLVACGAAAYICLGWLISPNGGLIALFAPRTAARMLFTIRANVAYKLGLAFGALALGLVVYSVWRRLGPWLWRERSRVLTAIVVFQLLTYGVSCGLWFSRLSYTCRDASRALGEHVAEGEYVLGERALSLSFHNRIKPLYWHPGIAYANKDEGRIRARFDPRFMVLPEIQVDALRNGALPCSPYVASFLENEIARFPIYELHESPELSCDVILYRHEAAAE